MTRYILSIIVLCATLSQGMEVNAPLLPDSQVLEKLRNILKDEKIKPGTFIKKIIDNLKQCTNGKMIELNFLTVKSSYWWDQSPLTGASYLNPHRFNRSKELIIDRHFQSSVYDRELGTDFTIGADFFKGRGLDPAGFVNSWQSVKEKIKFFRNKDVAPMRCTHMSVQN